ncbi:hypothetical protein Tco_0867749 [Tanacetum coccineum]
MPSSLSPEPMFGYINDLDFFKDFKNEFPAIAYNDLKSKSDLLIEPSVSSQHIDRFETSLSEYDEKEQNVLYLNDPFPLNEEIAEARFGAYWSGSERVIPDKGDLRDYWMEISSDRDFLRPAPSYVFIRDPVQHDLAIRKSTIWYTLKKTCVELVRAF